MGRHRDDESTTPGDWEEPPPVAPVWRSRIVTSAVLLLAVVAGTWWAVSWLTSPAGPGGAGTPSAASLPGDTSTSPGASAGGVTAQVLPAVAEVSPAVRGVSPSVAASGDGTPDTGAVTVHVAGEVNEPGLVALPAGARVADALQAAGGPTGQAELDRLNLAAPAVDASQILVPGPDTPSAASGTVPAGVPAGPDTPGGPKAEGDSDGGTVNVNTADAAALEQLPGIGPALAGRIVEHREQVGPFGSMDDLDAVSGIGPAMMERLDGLVSW